MADALASGALVALVVLDAPIASDAVAVTVDFGKPVKLFSIQF
ncbi:hypothetical protein GCM10007971_18390 [Oceanobacillus indicireducens]|uniref:Uncharacterized protein n=1 Tax=Oceanobacillus indicireducens TaxID=1004261 RepID=A0A917XXX0_9BACI|nr:hypothetical protein GCM10007971_18390 [Oceanobacillus indicireducens]